MSHDNVSKQQRIRNKFGGHGLTFTTFRFLASFPAGNDFAPTLAKSLTEYPSRSAPWFKKRKFPSSQRALRNVIQSGYTWCECSREGFEGRFGARLMWEIPHSYGSPERDSGMMMWRVNISTPRSWHGALMVSSQIRLGRESAKSLPAQEDNTAFKALQELEQ